MTTSQLMPPEPNMEVDWRYQVTLSFLKALPEWQRIVIAAGRNVSPVEI